MTMRLDRKLMAALAALALAPLAGAEPSDRYVQDVMKRDFHAKGQAKMDRMEQDVVQRICTASNDRPPSGLAKVLEGDQMKTIVWPADGKLLGNWKEGAKIAWSGRGMQWNEDPKKPSGGGCYNCHIISPERESAGTIGPSLRGFGKISGYGIETQPYVHGKLYNAKAYNLCSHMQRFGHTDTLPEPQIKDLTAYLLATQSPVNQ